MTTPRAVLSVRSVKLAENSSLQSWRKAGGPTGPWRMSSRKADSPLIGAVAYFPEKYGSGILPIVLQCLNGEAVPPAVYVEHKLIARDQILSFK